MKLHFGKDLAFLLFPFGKAFLNRATLASCCLHDGFRCDYGQYGKHLVPE